MYVLVAVEIGPPVFGSPGREGVGVDLGGTLAVPPGTTTGVVRGVTTAVTAGAGLGRAVAVGSTVDGFGAANTVPVGRTAVAVVLLAGRDAVVVAEGRATVLVAGG
jgi:hypothetical protein